MELLSTYIPMDRRQAMARGEDLPDRTCGAALFADISGFTPLTEVLVKTLGPGQAAQEVISQLNQVYEALITEVHRYHGSVIGFVGDAITCWFDAGSDLVNEQAGLRATACGIAMQQVMKPFATSDLLTGDTISLAIKVAIATGPARRFLVGNPQIQYIDTLAGTAVQQMTAAEKHAQKGEVVLAPAAITQLAGKVAVTECSQKAETSEQFAVVECLHESVDPTPWLPLPPTVFNEAQVRPWLLAPVYERLMAGQGHFQAEMRPAVALFLKFGGLDYDCDQAADQKLDDYVRWVQQVLTRYEGHLIQLTIGDKGSYIYAAFGAPLAHDDDPDRAVAAALDLQSLSAMSPVGRDIQIGLTQGQMRTGAYGSQQRQTYGVISNKVNLAARLMTNAAPGQILASQEVANAVNHLYHLEYIGPIKVKGKVEPMDVSMVWGRRQTGARRPLSIYDNPLVGREDELAWLAQILDKVADGEGRLVRLTGVAGIGKSHLASTFADQALHRGWRVVTGFCQSTSQNIPYHPWRQIFRALFVLVDDPTDTEDPVARTNHHIAQVSAIIEEMNPDWPIRLPLLGDLLGLPIPDNVTTAIFDPKLRQEALHTLAVELIQSWIKDQPLLLLLEDVHWLDEASQGLLLALARVITQTPVVLTIVHRPPLADYSPILPDLNQMRNCHQLDLRELSPTGVTTLAAHRLQGQLSALLLNLIQIEAQGNPFYVEQLVEALRDAGHLEQNGQWTLAEPIVTTLRVAHRLIQDEAGQLILNPALPLDITDLGLPGSLHGLVLSRLDRLPEEHKLTLKVASVIGRHFDVELLAGAHPVELKENELLAQLDFVAGYEFIRLEQPSLHLSYIFRHDITREVVYETLLEDQQRRLHLAVAEATERLQPEAVEQLAHHYSQAGIRDKSMIYLGRAARKTQREYANETALHYYAQALTLEEHWEWRKGQVEILHMLGWREEEEAALEALAANPAAPDFEIAHLQGQYHEAVGNYAEARAAVERAIFASKESDNLACRVCCLNQLGLIARRQGDYEQVKIWYEQALSLFTNQETRTDEEAQALVQTYIGLGTAHRQQGDFDEARTHYEQAMILSRKSGNLRGQAEALNSLGVTAFYQRNFAEALTYHRQALAIRRTIGDRAGEGISLYNMAMTTRDANDYGQAQQYLFEALSILRATGNQWDEANVWNELGIMCQELGNLAQAQACLERALQLRGDIGASQVYILGNLGLVVRDRGDLEMAETYLTTGLNLAQEQADIYIVSLFVSHLAIVSLLANNLEQAIERANQALTLRREADMQLWTTADLATLAAAYLAGGDTDRALNYAGQALTILDDCGGEGPELPQRDYFICYQVLDAVGRAKEARLALQSAYNLVIARVEKITDLALRQSFLAQVAVNRKIVTKARQILGSGL